MKKTAEIVIAGIPRCGTTLMARAAAGIVPANQWPDRQEPIRGVIKRHAAIELGDASGIIAGIFLFGNIEESILSTRRTRMDEKHLQNCLCPMKLKDVDILRRDDLRYENIFDDWTGPWAFPILSLRYETFWNHIQEIEEFLGRQLTLPEKKARVTKPGNFSGYEVSLIKNTYKSLIEKVKNMPDFSIENGG